MYLLYFSVEDIKMRATTLLGSQNVLNPNLAAVDLTQKQRWLLSSLDFLKKHVAQRPSETSVSMQYYGQAWRDIMSFNE